ncbi:SMU1112c/YaeR family gloxylase I-like metalloprotein [Maribacter antarcticus]|uniref:SMU1112c/YaeR family gloxylase I-like metalloprotein n=1 Tax=Maribacter antarcticus TaxID=505250 RepID=UPI00047E718A|nr:VOC family protein [Maribacter antarcticus]
MLQNIHHIAIICSDYPSSKKFYTQFLGLQIINETYREERKSYKLDLSLNGTYIIELFSFPNPPKRTSRPESCGLRHLAFDVEDLNSIVVHYKKNTITIEPIRVDKLTNKKFTFIADPHDLPIEFYQQQFCPLNT